MASGHRAMTPDEIRIIEALSGCSFVPGSSPKRLVRQLNGRDRAKPLTDRQREYLWAIAWSWRRQLPAGLVALARRYSGGIGIRGRQSIIREVSRNCDSALPQGAA